MLPVAPFTVVNIFVGALGIRYSSFIIGTFIGLLPGTLTTVVVGDRIWAALPAHSLDGCWLSCRLKRRRDYYVCASIAARSDRAHLSQGRNIAFPPVLNLRLMIAISIGHIPFAAGTSFARLVGQLANFFVEVRYELGHNFRTVETDER